MKKLLKILKNKTLALTITALFVSINISIAAENEFSESEIAVNKDFERLLRKEWIESISSEKEAIILSEIYNQFLSRK